MSKDKSFGIVEEKVLEAEFFLLQMKNSRFNIFEFKCYFNAFISSCRTITYSLQAKLNHLPEFNDWYSVHQNILSKNKLASLFLNMRNVNIHLGEDAIKYGSMESGIVKHYFLPNEDFPEVPSEDIETCCNVYFKSIVEIIYDCYIVFGSIIDSHQRYTKEYFNSIGMTIEDAEEELGYPRGWTDTGDIEASLYRWEVLRDGISGCEINHIFLKYLNKSTPLPERLPPYDEENKTVISKHSPIQGTSEDIKKWLELLKDK